MPFSLPPPEPWASHGWKVKIRDRERVESPHVSVMHRTRTWRIDLRTGAFMDAEPPPGVVPRAVAKHVHDHLGLLARAWDRTYPEDPIRRAETADE